MIRRLTLIAVSLCLFVSSRAFAQEGAEVGLQAGPAGMNLRIDVNDGAHRGRAQASAHEEISSDKPGESFKLTYDSAGDGRSAFKVLQPEGMFVRVTEGGVEVLSDTIPTRFSARAGRYYRFEIGPPEGILFDKKFEAKAGMEAQLFVRARGMRQDVRVVVNAPPPPPPASSCLPGDELTSIRGAIEGESFSDGKLSVLQSALDGRSLCVGQVVEVLDLYNFSADKLKALRMMSSRISDGQNRYKILAAFTFDADKKQAKAILGN